ncbi:hypothetical protein AAJ72_07670 [Citromicrobium sp. RCC1885]|nr:hypothetical protein AAJ72_07670 [Citromicrobium sp. RCC1885]KPM28750.1 hypothetical protein AAJ74_08410 [Citromicrobium sp. RCC1878]
MRRILSSIEAKSRRVEIGIGYGVLRGNIFKKSMIRTELSSLLATLLLLRTPFDQAFPSSLRTLRHWTMLGKRALKEKGTICPKLRMPQFWQILENEDRSTMSRAP